MLVELLLLPVWLHPVNIRITVCSFCRSEKGSVGFLPFVAFQLVLFFRRKISTFPAAGCFRLLVGHRLSEDQEAVARRLSSVGCFWLLVGYYLSVVAYRCGVPFHSYVSEVADDGDVLGGVELEVRVARRDSCFERRFFWACASAGLPPPHDQAALQAVCFLQEFYGFVVQDYNYHCMLAYRELARSAFVLAASIVRTAGPSSVSDVDATTQWRVLYSQLVSSACEF